jgi:transposase
MRKDKKRHKKIDIYALEQINLNAAGADIGASEIYVAVPPDRDEESVRSFPTFTADLQQLADWLANCGIETIAMESTGVYWIPLYEILESRGFDVCLVNAQHLKNVNGRKSDVLDCQWIQQLHTYGLLSASFRPPENICAIRSLVRHRDMLVRYRSAHIQHMQKALQLMNIQLTIVLSDITGVTGQKIIRSIVAGERDPKILASFRHNKCSRSESDIEKALEGNYKFEHVFALKQALELYDFYDQQIQTCDAELEKLYLAFEPVEEPATHAPSPRTGKRRKNQPYFDLSQSLFRISGVDLVRIDGLDAMAVQKIISEVGLDMTKWPTVKHFTSWLRLSPNNLVTGGKTKRRGTQPTQNRANTAFRLAALSLTRSNSALGGFYRRMRARKGAPKAITATAHKLARIFYCMLKHRREYCDPGFDYYEKQYQERVFRNLRRKAAQLGYSLEPISTTSPFSVSPVS